MVADWAWSWRHDKLSLTVRRQDTLRAISAKGCATVVSDGFLKVSSVTSLSHQQIYDANKEMHYNNNNKFLYSAFHTNRINALYISALVIGPYSALTIPILHLVTYYKWLTNTIKRKQQISVLGVVTSSLTKAKIPHWHCDCVTNPWTTLDVSA